MKKLVALLSIVALLPLNALAHAGLYHNYAGSGGLGFVLWLTVLVLGLLVYEKQGDNLIGHWALFTGIEIPLFVVLAFPDTARIGLYGYLGIAVIAAINFAYIKLRRAR